MDFFYSDSIEPRSVSDCPIEPIANTLCKSELTEIHSKSRRRLQRARSKSTDTNDSNAGLRTLKITKMVHNNPIHSIKEISYASRADGRAQASASMNYNEEVTEAHLSYNKLKSLKYLHIFPKLATINADHNEIKYICSDCDDFIDPEGHGKDAEYLQGGKSYNFMRHKWPMQMKYLLNLDLSYNMIESLPDLKSMPALRSLCLKRNLIVEPLDTIEYGVNLEILDLSENKLSWSPQEFVDFSKILGVLAKLRNIHFHGNPFIDDLPNYINFVAKFSSVDSFLANVDTKAITWQIKHDASGEELTEDQILLSLRKVHLRNLEDNYKSNESGRVEHQKTRNNQETTNSDYSNDITIDNSEPIHFHVIVPGRVPKLIELKKLVALCFEEPTLAQLYMQEFAHAVNLILGHREEHELLVYGFTEVDFHSLINNSDRIRSVQNAMQNMLMDIHLLMDREVKLQDLILESIAKLVGVTKYSIGQSCLDFLDYLLNSSDDLQDIVINQLGTYFVPLISNTISSNDEQLQLRADLLAALATLRTPKNNKAMEELLSHLATPIIKWLTEDGDPLTIEILTTISMSCSHAKSVQNFAESELKTLLVKELDKTKAGSTTYLLIVEIIGQMAKQYTAVGFDGKLRNTAADFFCQDCELHHKLLVYLNRVLKSSKGIYTDELNHQVETTLSCLSALCRSQYGANDLLVPLGSEEQLQVNQLSAFFRCLAKLWEDEKVPAANISPKTMAALLNTINCLLRLPHSWFPLKRQNSDRLLSKHLLEEQICYMFDDVVPVLQYLDPKDVNGFQRMAIRAIHSSGDGKSNVLRQKMHQIFSIEMKDLLCAVIRLIMWYCIASTSANPSKCALQTSEKMDERNRDLLIFGCLECPSDDVRKIAMNCLICVPEDQLGQDEILILVETLKSMRNISAGESEAVIGLSYVLLTRLMISTSQAGSMFRGENSAQTNGVKNDSGEDEADQYIDPDLNDEVNIDTSMSNASVAIITALRILVQNASRDTGNNHDEALEKAELSSSMIDFLIAASATKLKNELSNSAVSEQLCYTLHYEDIQSTRFVSRPVLSHEMSRKNFVPLPVERIWTGAQIRYLIDAIKGTYTNKPLRIDGVVLQRLLRRIADIAMGIRDPTIQELRGDGNDSCSNIHDTIEDSRVATRLVPFFAAFGIKRKKISDGTSESGADDTDLNSEDEEGDIVDDDDNDDVMDDRKRLSIQKLTECEWRELHQEFQLDHWWLFQWPLLPSLCTLKPQTSHVYQQRRYLHEFDGLAVLLQYTVGRSYSPSIFEKDDSHAYLLEYFSNREEHNRSLAMKEDFRNARRKNGKNEEGDKILLSGQKFLLHMLVCEDRPLHKIYVAGHSNSENITVENDKETREFIQGNQKSPEPVVCREESIRLAPLLRLLYTLTALNADVKQKDAFIEYLRSDLILLKLANQVTGSTTNPNWYEYNLGAKYLAVLNACTRMAPDTCTEAAKHIELYSLIFSFWGAIIRHPSIARGHISYEEQSLLYQGVAACTTALREMMYLRTKDAAGLGCVLDLEAMDDFMTMWFNEAMIKNSLYILTKALLVWRDQSDDGTHHHHSRSHQKLRQLTKVMLIEGLCDIISTLVVISNSKRRHAILSEISREQVEEIMQMPNAFLQEILNHVNWKMKKSLVVEACLASGICKDPCLERVHLCVPSRIGVGSKLLSKNISLDKGKLDVWLILTTENIRVVYTSNRTSSIFDSAILSKVVASQEKKLIDSIRLDYIEIENLTLGKLNDTIFIELKSEERLVLTFSKACICKNAFNELSRFVSFYCNQAQQHVHRERCHRHDRLFSDELNHILASVLQNRSHKSLQDHNSKSHEKDADSFSLEAIVLARVHWFDAQNGGKLIGKRILCLTDTHFLLLVDMRDIEESDVRFKELKSENSEGKAEDLIVENLNFRSKKLKVLCHPLEDLVEFAEDDTQQEAMLYMGFVPAKENDNALLLGKADDQDDLIYSEASFHYTFAFQEYGDKGFIDALHKLVANDG